MKSLNIFLLFILSCIPNNYFLNNKEKLNLIKNDAGSIKYWETGIFPLLILVPDSVDEDRYNMLLQATQDLNIRSDCVVFDVTRRSDLDLVFTGFYEYYEYGKVVFKVEKIKLNRLAETEIFLLPGTSGQIKAAEIRLDPSTPMEGLQYVFLHELLHVLALGHDLNKNSIMYRVVHASKYQIEQIDLNHVRNICNGLMSFDLDSIE